MKKSSQDKHSVVIAQACSDYQKHVAHFIELQDGIIRAAQRELFFATWDFFQHMNKKNQAKFVAANTKYFELQQNTTAYTRSRELMDSEHFEALDIISSRALEEIKEFFAQSIYVANEDNSETRLYRDLEARKAELLTLLNTSSTNELLAGTACGMTKPFAELLRELVLKRNVLARLTGSANYYRMQIGSDREYDNIHGTIKELKLALDSLLEKSRGVPKLGVQSNEFSLSKISSERKRPHNIVSFSGELLGLSKARLEAILAVSDLHPRADKHTGGLIYPADSPFDVRVLLNIPEDPAEIDAYHIKCILHEVIGHGVDYTSIRKDLPGVLRGHHSFSGEVMALLAERLRYEPRWLNLVGGLDAQTIKLVQKHLQKEELQSTLESMREAIAIVEFETSIYEDPDQDLDALYTKLHAWCYDLDIAQSDYPRGKWSLWVPHFVDHPAYFHNYLLGTAWAIQIRAILRRKFGSFASKRVGPYLAKRRCTGLLYSSKEQLEQITGEPFNCQMVIKALNDLLSEAQKASQTI